MERYARNDHLGLMIPYEFQGVDHYYEPDFLVQLVNGLTLLLEVKGFEDAQTAAKHEAARRWVGAVNHAQEFGRWGFHVCRDPKVLGREIEAMVLTSEL